MSGSRTFTFFGTEDSHSVKKEEEARRSRSRSKSRSVAEGAQRPSQTRKSHSPIASCSQSQGSSSRSGRSSRNIRYRSRSPRQYQSCSIRDSKRPQDSSQSYSSDGLSAPVPGRGCSNSPGGHENGSGQRSAEENCPSHLHSVPEEEAARPSRSMGKRHSTSASCSRSHRSYSRSSQSCSTRHSRRPQDSSQSYSSEGHSVPVPGSGCSDINPGQNHCLLVVNLGRCVMESAIYRNLKRYGCIGAQVASNSENGRSYGFGFAFFKTEADAVQAKNEANCRNQLGGGKVALDFLPAGMVVTNL